MNLQNLNWRYSTKLYDNTKKVNDHDLNELLEVLRLTPSSFGLEPWKFILVTDKELREKLRAQAWNQSQVTDASHLIILCARTNINEKYVSDFVKRTAEVRGTTSESLAGFEGMLQGFRKGMSHEQLIEWAKKQVYIASGFLMFAAAEKQIDCTPMEGFSPKGVDEILGLEGKHLTSVLLMTIGYRAHDDKYAQAKKVRFAKDDVVIRM